MHIKNRYDFVAHVSVARGNPNGDPDNDNHPRVDYTTGRGIISDVCVKRRVRNYLMEHVNTLPVTQREGAGIYYTDGAVLAEVNEAATGKRQAKESLTDALMRMYWDVRTFGAVAVSSKFDGGKITGPVQIATSLSCDPIEVQTMTITRMCATNKNEKSTDETGASNRTMGKKYIVPFALYRIEGTIAPAWAYKTGFSDQDLELFIRAMVGCWDTMTASSGVRGIHSFWAFKHESYLGNAPRSTLLSRVKAVKNDGVVAVRDIADYKLSVNSADLPAGVELEDWLVRGWSLINKK
jgi:CRISPR-associated protein Csd2